MKTSKIISFFKKLNFLKCIKSQDPTEYVEGIAENFAEIILETALSGVGVNDKVAEEISDKIGDAIHVGLNEAMHKTHISDGIEIIQSIGQQFVEPLEALGLESPQV